MRSLFQHSKASFKLPSFFKESASKRFQTLLIECPHGLSQTEEIEKYKFKIATTLEHQLIPLLIPKMMATESAKPSYLDYGRYLWRWDEANAMEDIVELNGKHAPLAKEIDPQGSPLIGLFTSGSTGRPKLIWHRVSNYEHAAKRSSELLNITPQTKLLSALPCYHNGGFLNLVRQDLYPHDLTLVKHNQLIAQWIELRPQIVVGVPTQLQQGLDQEMLSGQTFYCGGAALDRALWLRARERGMTIYGTYGLTESCGAILYKEHPDDPYQPLRDVQVELSPTGTLQFSCPSNALGLQCEDNVEVITGPWVTADRAQIDSVGRVLIEGRNDHMIICSGENIDPHEIDKVIQDFLAAQNQWAQIQIIGMPDPIKGQIPLVLIEGLELWPQVQRELLIETLRASLSPLKKPRFLMPGLSPDQGIKVTPTQVRQAFDQKSIKVWKV